MTLLFIHQNFPGQYVHVVRRLASQPRNRVYFITQTDQTDLPNVTRLLYKPDLPVVPNCHPYTVPVDAAVRTGAAVAALCRELRDSGTVPDLIVGHCGWGETLFVKDVFRDVPVLTYFEFFYHTAGADVGFDPEFAPSCPDDASRLQVRNFVNRLSFASTEWGHTATKWQRSLFPAWMQSRIVALHEGVDTVQVRPDPNAWMKLARENVILTRQDEVLTYVSRNLEPYRGFHIFLRALPEILRRRPQLRVLIVGGDGVSYSPPPPYGGSYREMLVLEGSETLDLSRVHFLGQIPYHVYLNVLQVSSVHVHLTYPFVLSWSFIEALAAGCLVVGSATAPVLEILRHEENGFAADFFSVDGLADMVTRVLDQRHQLAHVSEAARATAVRDFDLNTVIMPRWNRLLNTLAKGKLPREMPAEDGLGLHVR